MKAKTALLIVCVLWAAVPARCLEIKDCQLGDGFGPEALYDCTLNYYYHIPCPIESYYWAYYGWEPGEMIGVFFEIGDISMGPGPACDPLTCFTLEQISVLDFAGYGTMYPGLFTVEFEVYCADDQGCPIGAPIWNSGPWETHFTWNCVPVDPPLCLSGCVTQVDPAAGFPRILVTAVHTGTDGCYPAWGMDNVGTAVRMACEMHDISCSQALYPRPYNSHHATIHTGYYGIGFEYCPPLWFPDGHDTSPDATQYGYIELAWSIYLSCEGPTALRSTTWGGIKSIYR